MVAWTSSDPSVATVNHVGFVTPLREGEVEISVSYTDPETLETCTATCSVQVTEEPQYTYAQPEQMANDEARDIANYLRNTVLFILFRNQS